MEGEMFEGRQLAKGLWEQLDHSNYKWVIYNEDGEPIGVSYEEFCKEMSDYSPEAIRRKQLGMVKSVERGFKLIQEALIAIQQDENIKYITGEIKTEE